MKKKVPQRRKHIQPKRASRGGRKAAVIFGLVLSLGLTGIILAQFKAARVATGVNAVLAAPAPPTPTPLSPASPSKEYIYAGGKLIATEEPTAAPAPTPTPPAGGQTEEVVWTNSIGATPSGNDLTKIATTGWGNSGAVSTKALASGDGFVEFTAAESGTSRMCGLSDGDSTQSYQDIKYAFQLHSSGNVNIYESGTQRSVNGSTVVTTYVPGDRLRVSVEGGAVKYYKNGALLYTSAVAPTYPLLVDTALYTTNATVSDAYIAGTLTRVLPDRTPVLEVNWTNAVGVSAAGNNLTKTTTTAGWNSGASSTQSLASGDGFVEFTTNEANLHKMCGLNVGDASQSYTDINFAIYPRADGSIYIYESGNPRSQNGSQVFGTYAAGDRFRVAVEGGVVKYYQNGTLLYQSGVTPTYPLLVDTSLYTSGATIKDVIVAGFAP